METDVKLKKLVKTCGRDFLWLTGDLDATALSVDVLELQAPVLTTVLYVAPPGPAEPELVYRVTIAGKEINAWRFAVVRLWEVEVESALQSGVPGLLALVPLLKGGNPAAVWKAARKIRSVLPGQEMSEPEAILWLLAEGCYNKKQLAQAAGRTYMQALLDLIKRSPLYQELWHEAKAEGKAEGKTEGKAEGETGLVLRQLERRLGPLPVSQQEAVRSLRLSEIEDLGETLLGFSSPAHLASWLRGTN